MRVALVAHRVTLDRDENLAGVLEAAAGAAAQGAELVLFPEAALTGLMNNDDPGHDLPLGVTVPGPEADRLAAAARSNGVYLGIGLLEREERPEGAVLYDSAFLFDPAGRIVLKYRRISPGWHGRRADPRVYRAGTEVPAVRTPLGTVSFLICGDLFDDRLLGLVRDLRPDWLLLPYERCFDDFSYDQRRWDRYVAWRYARRARVAGVPLLMAGSVISPELGGGAFGGAMAVSAEGRILASLPLGRVGTLAVDL
ncbi:MAG: carbon-nitrogen hydrolase family protein [Firmicutes bacterium]|nr:carbon-nitrogen hydrolase family protein [Bacillota bacterium]